MHTTTSYTLIPTEADIDFPSLRMYREVHTAFGRTTTSHVIALPPYAGDDEELARLLGSDPGVIGYVAHPEDPWEAFASAAEEIGALHREALEEFGL